MEGFVVFGRPVGVLGFGFESPLLVCEVGPDEVDLHVGLEGLRLRGLQVVRGYH